MTTRQATDIYIDPDWGYVSKLLLELQQELYGRHMIIDEIEKLKYFESRSQIPQEEKSTGEELKIGMVAELLENVKAAILAGEPKVHIKAHRRSVGAEPNASAREAAWQQELSCNSGIISELVDSVLLGYGILKSAKNLAKWSVDARKRKRGETSTDYTDRVDALKKSWGPPMADVVVHPIAAYFRAGVGSEVDEIVEQSYKPKRLVYKQYEMKDGMMGTIPNTISPTGDTPAISTIQGHPNQYTRLLPANLDTSNYWLITEYWNAEVYKVWANSQLIYEEYEPSVKYFIAKGRSSSSPDPDKFAISIAEPLRHIEPSINKLMTRMLEATDLIVHKRLTLEIPLGSIPETSESPDGDTKPKNYQFSSDAADTLPEGAKLVDAYQGVEAVLQAMPMLQLMLQVANSSSVSPLFKGISPGAAGSGYRDNSLYLMAKSMFEYIIDSVEGVLTSMIIWKEYMLVHHIKQEVYFGEYSLKPSDITDFPATITVELKPELPQNLIANGEFWERQREAGNVSRKRVREQGLGIEQTDEEEDEVNFEQLTEQLKPYLFMDVIGTVLGKGPMAGGQSGLVNSQGQPISSGQNGQNPLAALGASSQPGHSTSTNGRTGQQQAGFATSGQARQPAMEPMSMTPTNRENR